MSVVPMFPMSREPVVVRDLRAVLTLAIHRAARPLSVSELVAIAEAAGVVFTAEQRPGKVVSDALRSDVSRGWVRRAGRGRYAPGYLPKSTQHRLRARAAALAAP